MQRRQAGGFPAGPSPERPGARGFYAGAQDLLLLPGTLFTSVLGIILGYIVLNQGIQVIFLGQLEIALLHVTDRLFDREIRITAFQEPYPLDDVGIHTQVLELP